MYTIQDKDSFQVVAFFCGEGEKWNFCPGFMRYLLANAEKPLQLKNLFTFRNFPKIGVVQHCATFPPFNKFRLKIHNFQNKQGRTVKLGQFIDKEIFHKWRKSQSNCKSGWFYTKALTWRLIGLKRNQISSFTFEPLNFPSRKTTNIELLCRIDKTFFN